VEGAIRQKTGPMIVLKDIVCPFLPFNKAVRAYKNIVIKPETAVLSFPGITDGRALCVIDLIIIERTISELLRITGTVPDIYACLCRRYKSIILADAVVNAVVMPGTGPCILKEPKAATFILIRKAIPDR
jgi:hypothetical protein